MKTVNDKRFPFTESLSEEWETVLKSIDDNLIKKYGWGVDSLTNAEFNAMIIHLLGNTDVEQAMEGLEYVIRLPFK